MNAVRISWESVSGTSSYRSFIASKSPDFTRARAAARSGRWFCGRFCNCISLPAQRRYGWLRKTQTCRELFHRHRRPLHRLIFLYGGFGKLSSELQNGLKMWWSGFDKLCYHLLSKTVSFETVVREPLFHLLDGVWIIKCCYIFMAAVSSDRERESISMASFTRSMSSRTPLSLIS